jgi:hypothetical protein
VGTAWFESRIGALKTYDSQDYLPGDMASCILLDKRRIASTSAGAMFQPVKPLGCDIFRGGSTNLAQLLTSAPSDLGEK